MDLRLLRPFRAGRRETPEEARERDLRERIAVLLEEIRLQQEQIADLRKAAKVIFELLSRRTQRSLKTFKSACFENGYRGNEKAYYAARKLHLT